MKKDEIIKAWRDAEYFDNLDEDRRRILPLHPAGILEVDDKMLNGLAGGLTAICTEPTSGYCTPCKAVQCF